MCLSCDTVCMVGALHWDVPHYDRVNTNYYHTQSFSCISELGDRFTKLISPGVDKR